MTKAKILILVTFALLYCGCQTEHKYACTVIASKTVSEKEVRGNGDREMIVFRLRHKNVTITAHCESFDPKNSCGELRVGETYDFERDDKLRYLTLPGNRGFPPAILSINVESIGADDKTIYSGRSFVGLRPDEWAAIGTMVNAAVIIVLAVFNFRYMRSASQQATAAERQAKTASENYSLLKIQIEEQSGQARTRCLTVFMQMKGELIRQAQQLRSNLTDVPKLEFVYPDDWAEAIHWTEQRFAELRQFLPLVNKLISEAQGLIAPLNASISSVPANRTTVDSAATHLDRASVHVYRIIQRIEKGT